MPSLSHASPDEAGATFRSSQVEQEYRRDGYVVVPFLDSYEVASLRSLYLEEIATAVDDGLTIDYVRSDRRGMADVRAALDPYLDRHLPEVFSDHRAIFRTFVTKHPGHGSEMYLHEDRSWVDERRFRTGTLWIALDDVGPGLDNGGLEVVPGSHRLRTGWSGTNTPDVIRPYEDRIREHLVRPEVPAGSAIYYDSRTLHASEPNLSPRPRIAAVAGIAPRQAALVHVVATSERHRMMYAVDQDFFVRHHPGVVATDGMPDGYRVIEEFDEDIHLGVDDIDAALGPGEQPNDDAPSNAVGSFAARLRARLGLLRDRRGSAA